MTYTEVLTAQAICESSEGYNIFVFMNFFIIQHCIFLFSSIYAYRTEFIYWNFCFRYQPLRLSHRAFRLVLCFKEGNVLVHGNNNVIGMYDYIFNNKNSSNGICQFSIAFRSIVVLLNKAIFYHKNNNNLLWSFTPSNKVISK